MDVNNCRNPATAERPTTACMHAKLKGTPATVGKPTAERTTTSMETAGNRRDVNNSRTPTTANMPTTT